MLIICYAKCTTCQKARKWLIDNGINFSERDIKSENPSYDELKKWSKSGGIEINNFFNTNGILYRSMSLKNKLSDMTDEEKLKLLSGDGMLVKRPILVSDNTILIGFNEKKWSEALKKIS